MKTRITLRLDSQILRKVRAMAAENGMTISEFLEATFQEIVQGRDGYARAKKRALARLRKGHALGCVRPASRDELHER